MATLASKKMKANTQTSNNERVMDCSNLEATKMPNTLWSVHIVRCY